MLEFAIDYKSPIIIRYPRGGEDSSIKFENHTPIELGKAEVLKQGTDLSIIAIGKMVARAMKIANKLEQDGIKAEVVNARFLKPFDEKTIKQIIEKTKNVVTIEDGTIINGLGTNVRELIINEDMKDIKIKNYAYPDNFIEHGSVEELEKIYQLDEKTIQQEIKLLKNEE